MKHVILATATVALLAGPALAQTSKTVTTTTKTTTISPAEEAEMHEFVVREHRPAIAPPPGFVVSNGAVLPPAIELYGFPAENHWRYEYATIGDQTVVVDPDTRRIVTVIR